MGGQKHKRRKKGLKRRGQRQSELEKVQLLRRKKQWEKWGLLLRGQTQGSVKKKKGNFALMCDHAENNEQPVCVCVCHLEQLHQSLQLYHQLPPALLQRWHPLLQLIFPLSAVHTNAHKHTYTNTHKHTPPPLLSYNRVSGSNKGTQGLTVGKRHFYTKKTWGYTGMGI